MAIIKIAFRNLKEHKTKTLIIGIIISLGITILVIGNSMIDTAARGIEKNYIENYTGHLIITADTDMNLTLFGAMDIDSFTDAMPTIPQFFKIYKYAEAHNQVAALSGQAAGRAQLSFEEDVKYFTLLFGIDPDVYKEMFPDNIELLQGDFLQAGYKGLLISEFLVNRIKRAYGTELKVDDKLLLTGISAGGGAKIRELPVRGIFRFRNSNMPLNMVSLIDIDSLRSLNGMILGAELEVEVAAEEIDLIEDFNADDLFGQSMIVDINQEEGIHTEEDLYSILGDTSERDLLSQTDSGAWHFLLLRLKNPAVQSQIIADFENFFIEQGILAKISDWKSGAGPVGQMADILKIVFNIIVLIIAVVAIIIIMNALVISITERISEIGTMRALGAQKGFVRLMIMLETIIISVIFGVIGIIVGAIILGFLGLFGLTAPNMFFEVIFGGKVLYPVMTLPSFLQSLLIIIVIGIVSSLYPVWVALKIQPVKAIQSD